MNIVAIICSMCPIFAISCVNGRNLDLLLKFLNALPPLSNSGEREKVVQDLTEHQVGRCSFLLLYEAFHVVLVVVVISGMQLTIA